MFANKQRQGRGLMGETTVEALNGGSLTWVRLQPGKAKPSSLQRSRTGTGATPRLQESRSRPPTPFAPDDPSTQRALSSGGNAPSFLEAREPRSRHSRHLPSARQPGEARVQVTAPALPTPPAASPSWLFVLRRPGGLGSSRTRRGVALRPTCATPAPGRRGGPGRLPAGPGARTSPAPAGSAGSPGAARLSACERLHCDAARSSSQWARDGANR